MVAIMITIIIIIILIIVLSGIQNISTGLLLILVFGLITLMSFL